MTDNKWYGIPKLREGKLIISESGKNDITLTQIEAEDLLWRLKQGVYLLKHGNLPNQHA